MQTQSQKFRFARTMNSGMIYRALKEDIFTLKLHPGQMLSENVIAEQYSVSRTPVKNAFIRLEQEGFIEVVPQKGTFVTLIDFRQIQDILYMRYVLEVDMLRTIMNKPYIEDVAKKLQDNLNEQKQLIFSGKSKPASFHELDSEFHHLLFSQVGREHIWSIIQDNEVNYTRFRILDTYVTARYNQLYQEHMDILEALCDRDEKRMQQNVYNHLHSLLDRFSQEATGEHRDYLANFPPETDDDFKGVKYGT